MDYPKLFEPGKIGGLEVKNRIVMPPMVRNYATSTGRVSERYKKHIESIARGGVGLMLLEASFIDSRGKGFGNQLGIDSDDKIAGLKELTKIAHRHNVLIGIQLYHAGRQTSSKVIGRKPLAPSAITEPSSGETPQMLRVDEIEELVNKFGDAARRAKEAGFDCVEIHGAHGYLITQFLSPFSNQRKDRYGGTFENRLRFLTEVVIEVRHNTGREMPIIVRLSADELVTGGLKVNESKKIAQHLENIGVDALHISCGNYASYAEGYMIPPMAVMYPPMVEYAAKIKAVVGIPVICVGQIHDPKLANQILSGRKADFIAVGRSLLADPDWPNKAQHGKEDTIRPCISCNQGCISRLFAQEDIWCVANPSMGREAIFESDNHESKKVVIVGGGAAGMSAAIYARQRGHKVVLLEQSEQLGGQFKAAGAAPLRQNWLKLYHYFCRELVRLHVDIRTETVATVEIVSKLKPDFVILATGSEPFLPEIATLDKITIKTARDVLTGRRRVRGNRVIVAGGGCAGAQTAEYLAYKGHRISLIEQSPTIAHDAPVDERYLLLERLKHLKVEILTNTRIVAFEKNRVQLHRDNKISSQLFDDIVFCYGAKSNNQLAKQLKNEGLKVKIVGDAIKPRRFTDAITEGALAAINI